jgi:glycosyltransferase involved in cell wall biosynthesis
MPRVSVIVPAYNAADTIGQALESAFAQSFTDYEVIIVDDGSIDAIDAAIAPYLDRVTLIRQRNRGISAARNAGAASASGEYIAFLDADDIWMPQRLARTVAVLEADPRCVMVSAGAMTIDKDGTQSVEYAIERAASLTPGLADIVSGKTQIKVSSILIRSGIFERAGGFDEASFGRLRGGEDSYLYALASEHGTIRLVPEGLVKYRAELTRNRMWKYERGRRILIRKWRKRYGGKINSPLRIQIRMWVREWNEIGIAATERANLKMARAAFRAALRLEPWRWRLRARMMRTYLPPRVVARMADRRAERKRISRGLRAKT